MITKLRVAHHHCAEALMPLRERQRLHHWGKSRGGSVEVASPATSKCHARSGQFKVGQGDRTSRRSQAVVFFRMGYDQRRCFPKKDIMTRFPPRNSPVHTQ